ncbi:MAG: hypothetical protein F4072_04020, partial [Acidimicrobiaceae bacterium]|nr:hypothetical protein [Acidimicrobiaceae bacterium]
MRVAAAGALAVGALLTLGSNAAAGASGSLDGTAAASTDILDVVEVSGFLDGIMADFIERSIEQASAKGSLGLVLQVNSPRAIVDDERLVELAARIRSSDVPVYMWVGPSGSVATGAVGQLAGVVGDLAVAPGSNLGDHGPQIHPAEHLAEPFPHA